VNKHAEFVEPDVIIWKNCFLGQRQENITKSWELFDSGEI